MYRAIPTLLTCIAVSTACGDTDETCFTPATECGIGAEEPAGGADRESSGGPGVLIHTTAFTPDFGASSYLYAVDELTPDLVLDAATAIELGGRIDVSVPPREIGMRSFFVGLGEEPTIVRYDIDDDGNISVGGELSLQSFGAMDANSLISGLTFVSRNRAYFIDVGTLQVIVIDPERMVIVSDFPLTGIAAPDLKTTYAWYKNIDRDRIVVAFAFDRNDDTPSPLSKVAIIDTTNDTVVYDEQSRCGYLSWTARDAAGNIYFVSHTYVAILNEAGIAGNPTFPPCMVRMLSGANGFDPDYYVDLYQIAGRPVGALMSGADDTAYTLVYSESADPLTPDTVDAAYGTEAWTHHSMKLGDEAATFGEVPGVVPGIPYSAGQRLTVAGAPVPVVTRVAQDFAETIVYDASNPTSWTRLATVPNYIYGIHDLP